MPTGYIAITFTPNFIGDHRLCWRIGTGAYTCFTFSCGGSTSPCTVYIDPIDFNNEACDPIEYNGYIQPSCEDPNTLDGAVFWSQDFVPDPSCDPIRITCIGEETVNGITITLFGTGATGFPPPRPTTSSYVECMCATGVQYNLNLAVPPVPLTDTTLFTPGTTYCGIWNGVHKESPCWKSGRGWDPCTPGTNPGLSGPPCNMTTPCYEFYCYCIYKPIITIDPPPSGVTATAQFIMGYGGIVNSSYITIVNQGTGPNITQVFSNVLNINSNIQNPGLGNPPGFGKQHFDVYVTNGKVTQVIPLNSPPGYYFVDDEYFSFSPGDIGGVAGVILQVKPGGTDLGKITGIEITNPGSGYISAPGYTITDTNCGMTYDIDMSLIISPGGTVLGPCPAFYPGKGCAPSEGIPAIIPSLPIGSTFILCYPEGGTRPPIPDSYEIEASDNCCYDCVRVLVATPTTPYPTITYTDCTSQTITVVTMNSPSMFLNCAVVDSWVSTDPATTFTEIGLCIT